MTTVKYHCFACDPITMSQGTSTGKPSSEDVDVEVEVNWSIEDAPSLQSIASTTDREAQQHLQALQASRFGVAQGQQELLAIEEIKDRIKLLDHQLSAAHRALFQMGSGALFADEVGLGKTIEVGMVLKEMDFRDTHHSFLILTPANWLPNGSLNWSRNSA